ncbi:NfeD family protein, partial [bacterium]|nr:NfeD family protein [bacterium]
FLGIRPAFTRFLHRFADQRETGINAYFGKTFKVTELIDNAENTGRVQVGSESWRARSENNEKIESGEMIMVKNVEGSTLFVRSISQEGK